MSADNVLPIRPPEGHGPDAFDTIYEGMQEQLDALRCALSILEASSWEADQELAAAVAVFRRAWRRLDLLHTDLEEWRMAQPEGQP